MPEHPTAPEPSSPADPAKAAAIEQWTADPCGSGHLAGEPGTAEYFERLLKMRDDYAPWMAAALDYEGAAGLEVLDIGCGQGIDLARYARKGAYATGVDLTPRHVDLARAHLAAVGLEAEVVAGDAEVLPFAAAAFDRVSANGVLHHTPNVEAALADVIRVLRPGGRATIIVYNHNSLHYWIQQFLLHGLLAGGIVREGGMAGVLSTNVEHSSVDARPLVRVYRRRGLRRLLEDAGFQRVGVVVRHFKATDTIPTRLLARHLRPLRDPTVLARIGAHAGWYLVGTGYAPAGSGHR